MIAIDEITGAEANDVIRHGDDSAHRVHAWYEGKRWEYAHRRIDRLNDRAGYEAGEHLNHRGARKGYWIGNIFNRKRRPAVVEQGCLHGWYPPLSGTAPCILSPHFLPQKGLRLIPERPERFSG